MFHATVLITRAEEWCVEAETAEEARELLAQGAGHRCHLGDRLHAEVQERRVKNFVLSFPTRSTATSFNLADERLYAVHCVV